MILLIMAERGRRIAWKEYLYAPYYDPNCVPLRNMVVILGLAEVAFVLLDAFWLKDSMKAPIIRGTFM